jgi:hypothetical protein
MVLPSSSRAKPVVRIGPLVIGLALLFAVTFVIFCGLSTSLLPRNNNDSQTADQLGDRPILVVEARHYWRPDRRVLAENEHAKCVLLETTNSVGLGRN